MLQASSIEKKYGDLQILKGIDLTVAPAEIISIVGSSGAGKTTLLQILGTLDAPSSGQLLIEGKNPSKRVIALRADMDALPIIEENQIDYKVELDFRAACRNCDEQQIFPLEKKKNDTGHIRQKIYTEVKFV